VRKKPYITLYLFVLNEFIFEEKIFMTLDDLKVLRAQKGASQNNRNENQTIAK